MSVINNWAGPVYRVALKFEICLPVKLTLISAKGLWSTQCAEPERAVDTIVYTFLA